MIERLGQATGVVLSKDEYLARFKAAWSGIQPAFVKLERRQTFVEEGNTSFDAFRRGNWDEAKQIARSRLDAIRNDVAETPFPIRRLRVVEQPYTAYLRWELMALQVRAEAGEDIRLIDADEVQEYEHEGPLPELVFLGHEALYEVLYDASGQLLGAKLVDAADIVLNAYAEVEALLERATPIADYRPAVES